jgi:protein-disulfide isomerase
VTIVAFMDYECPFCQRGFLTMKELREKYRDDLRIVWKHRPLEFHEHAEAASRFAAVVRQQKGDAAFFTATERLFERQTELSDENYARIATALGIDDATWKRTVASSTVDDELAADSDLADDFAVSGTPHFFVNGLRVKGARPVEDFSTIIDSELARAAELRKNGTKPADIPTALLAQARPAAELVTIPSGAVLSSGPSIGPAKAPVSIHVFSDYQCPFCQRAEVTLRSVVTKYPKDVRVVWHDLPLGFHERARPAATFALEVRAQKGDVAFFKFNRMLFEKQDDLSQSALVSYAASLGLRTENLNEDRREQTHGPSIDRDAKLAGQLNISGTPAFVVDRYLVEGAQPARRFERLIRRVLAEQAAAKRKPLKR